MADTFERKFVVLGKSCTAVLEQVPQGYNVVRVFLPDGHNLSVSGSPFQTEGQAVIAASKRTAEFLMGQRSD